MDEMLLEFDFANRLICLAEYSNAHIHELEILYLKQLLYPYPPGKRGDKIEELLQLSDKELVQIARDKLDTMTNKEIEVYFGLVGYRKACYHPNEGVAQI